MRYSIQLFVLVLLVACSKEEEPVDPMVSDAPNILLIIADDLGKDAIAGYTEGSIQANTPNLDAIRNAGISFQNFWVYPTCSPTRASIITGKYGYRTGVKWANDALNPSEPILQAYIKQETNDTYATALIGKWHLSGENSGINPESFGMDYYAGLLRGATQNYYQWQLTENGTSRLQTDYVTEVFTDLSIDWINSQTQPWFLWLAYNAPHTPFHVPPGEMHHQGNLPEYTNGLDAMPYYMAAIEAMDFQIGRLLSAIPEAELDNTLIVFLGDNGTPNQVAQSPYSTGKAKGSLFQGGINVPLFISGAGVSRVAMDNSLISSTDLFATIAEVAGVSVKEINDSKSFKSLFSDNAPIREFQYSEMDNGTNNAWAISNGSYKLVVNANGEKQMYDLINDPYENTDLLLGNLTTVLEAAKTELEAELDNIRN